MKSHKPRIVLSTSGALFQSSDLPSLSPQVLLPKEVALDKSEMFLALFNAASSSISIPETLIVTAKRQEPVCILNDAKGRICWIDSKAIDAFFNRVFSIHLMTSYKHPSPLQLPLYVVSCSGRLSYCQDQAEVLRHITHTKEFIVQRFLSPRDQHAKKYRANWSSGQQTIMLITRKTAIPFNCPQSISGTMEIRALFPKPKPKRVLRIIPETFEQQVQRPISGYMRRKTMAESADLQQLAILKGIVTPYSASFSYPRDCIMTQAQNQGVEEFVGTVVRFISAKVEAEGDELRSATFDVLQDSSGKWYLLNVKKFASVNRETLVKVRAKQMKAQNEELRPRSRVRRSYQDLKRYFQQPFSRSMTHTSYIDLGEVQDKNIALYGRIKDSFTD